MPRNDREIEAVRKADHELLNDLSKKAETLQGRRISEIQERCAEIKRGIERLIEEKGTVLRGPAMKAEIVAAAKREMENGRRFVREELIQHLSQCQQTSSDPFPPSFAQWVFNAANAWKLFYLAFDEKDIDDAATSLPEIGTSEKQKEKRIKEIDAEIKRLSQMLTEQ